MKRYVLATLALLLVTFANAQSFKFGIKGGLNVTDMHFSSKVIDKSNRAGFFLAPLLNLAFPSSDLVLMLQPYTIINQQKWTMALAICSM